LALTDRAPTGRLKYSKTSQ